jgi:hypothetical protein
VADVADDRLVLHLRHLPGEEPSIAACSAQPLPTSP